MKPNICLGTAQFGMNYGVTNDKGQITKNEIKEILNFALDQKINYLDTAQSYGSSEINIGQSLAPYHKFKITSKLQPNKNNFWDVDTINKINNQFLQSLKRLKVEKLDTLLIHRYSDLKLKGSDLLIEWLKKQKQDQLINRVGISIYLRSDLNELPLEMFDLIQLPLSIYDQRMLNSGLIKNLKEKGISVFARSIFLQGLILSNSKWPNFISKDMYDHHKNLINFVKKNNITLLDAALAFVQNVPDINAIVVGISCKNDLIQIINSYKNIQRLDKSLVQDLNRFLWNKDKDLDPRSWKKV